FPEPAAPIRTSAATIRPMSAGTSLGEAGELVGGLVGELDRSGGNLHGHVLQDVRAPHLLCERLGLLGGSELDPHEYFVGVIDAAEERMALGGLLATQGILVELLLEGVEIALHNAHDESHLATSRRC